MAKARSSGSKPRRPVPRDQISEDLIAMLRVKEVDAAEAYVRRGRSHRGLTDAELAGAWMEAFRAYSDDPDPAQPFRAVMDDLESELNLRRIDPPFDSVRPELERLRAKAVRVLEQLKLDPERHAEFERDLQLDVTAFRARRDRQQN